MTTSNESQHRHAVAEISAGQGAITAVSFRQGKIRIRLRAEEEVTLQVAHPYRSHWRAKAWPPDRRLQTLPSSQPGVLTLVAPAGVRAIEISQATPPAQRWGRALGVVAVALLAGAALGFGTGGRRSFKRRA